MRERIEKGEHVALFASADIGHARKLVDDGRASAMTMFARNTLCVLAPSFNGGPDMKLSARNQLKGKIVGVQKGRQPAMCASKSVAA